MPINYKLYPPDWKDIRAIILARAGDACEGTPQFPDCRAANHQPHPETGSMVVLTIAHMDHDTSHNTGDNLRALCNRCHLSWDAKHHAKNAAETRRKRKVKAGQMEMGL